LTKCHNNFGDVLPTQKMFHEKDRLLHLAGDSAQ
jgi:hypothetical protein